MSNEAALKLSVPVGLGANDFHAYFNESFIFHPKTNKLCKIIGFDAGEVAVVSDNKQRDAEYIPLTDFTSECIRYPTLGYRTLGKGDAVVYLARKPGRVTRKGLRPDVVLVTYPECLAAVCQLSAATHAELQKRRAGWDLTAIVADPPTMSGQEAIETILSSKSKAVAFAIASKKSANEGDEFAITLWPRKDAALALFYSGQKHPSALSEDGKSWVWLDPCVRDVAYRKGVLT